MTGADWKHPHIIVLAGATALAFGGGYAIGSNRSPPRVADSPIILTNELTTAPPPRARPDENALIAENAEREEPARPPQAAQPEPAARPEPVERSEPRPPPRDADRDFVEPGLEGEPQGGKPEDE